jgi:predicted ester cyclase
MIHGSYRGPLAGIPATGRPVRISAMHLRRVADGKLTEHWEEICKDGTGQHVTDDPRLSCN